MKVEKIEIFDYDKNKYSKICDLIRSDIDYIITHTSIATNKFSIVKYKPKTISVEKLFSIYAIYDYSNCRYWIYTEDFAKNNDSYFKVIKNENPRDIDFIMQEIECRLKKYMYPEKLIEDPEVHKVSVYGNAAINMINTIRCNLFDEVNDYQDREDKYEVRELEIIREDGENKKVAKVKLHPSFYLTEDNPYLHRCYNTHSNETIANMIFLDIVQTLFASDEVWVDTGLTLNKVILFHEYLNEKENRIIIICKSRNKDAGNFVIIQKMNILKARDDSGSIYRCNMYDEYKGRHCSFESPDYFKIIKEIFKLNE